MLKQAKTDMTPIKSPKKLIEVALPLDDINAACAHEKMPGLYFRANHFSQ